MGKSKVTWFLSRGGGGGGGGKQVIKFANTRNRGRAGKERFLHLKDDNGRLWVEVITIYFLDAVATVDVLTAASKDDVNFFETRTVHFT